MRLLLAEDDIMLGEALQEALMKQGFVVDWMKDGHSALHALQSEHFDLAILDLGLPRRDGMEVLSELRRLGNELPVLILTARDALDSRVAGLDAGADDYLLKPFTAPALEERICRAIKHRLELRKVFFRLFEQDYAEACRECLFENLVWR